jgi:ribosomal protein L32E
MLSPDASKFLSASEAVSIDSAFIAVDCRAGKYNSKELVRLRFSNSPNVVGTVWRRGQGTAGLVRQVLSGEDDRVQHGWSGRYSLEGMTGYSRAGPAGTVWRKGQGTAGLVRRHAVSALTHRRSYTRVMLRNIGVRY